MQYLILGYGLFFCVLIEKLVLVGSKRMRMPNAYSGFFFHMVLYLLNVVNVYPRIFRSDQIKIERT